MFQLAQRQLEPEIMDDPQLDPAEHLRALRGLERVHLVSGTARRMWSAIEQCCLASSRSELSVMDVGCGNAFLVRNLWKKARRKNIALRLIGCDFSAQAIELAQASCEREDIPIQLHQSDVLSDPLPARADVVICSLFLHHFTNQQVIEILKKLLDAAMQRVLMEDLIRSRLGYVLCAIGAHTLTRSHVVHVDGLRSVRAAFSISEIRQLLTNAGMTDATVCRRWPERFLVSYAAMNESKRADNV